MDIATFNASIQGGWRIARVSGLSDGYVLTRRAGTTRLGQLACMADLQLVTDLGELDDLMSCHALMGGHLAGVVFHEEEEEWVVEWAMCKLADAAELVMILPLEAAA